MVLRPQYNIHQIVGDNSIGRRPLLPKRHRRRDLVHVTKTFRQAFELERLETHRHVETFSRHKHRIKLAQQPFIKLRNKIVFKANEKSGGEWNKHRRTRICK